GGGPAVVFADGVDGGHAGDDGQPVGGHHKGDAHKDDGNNQPDQGVPVVCAQHGGGGHRAGANDDAGGHQTGADPFQQFPQGQSFNVSAIDSFILTHKEAPFRKKRGAALRQRPTKGHLMSDKEGQ